MLAKLIHVFLFFSKPQTSPTRNDEQVVEKYYSVAEFSGSGRGEMSLKENEVVTVIEKNSTGLKHAGLNYFVEGINLLKHKIHCPSSSDDYCAMQGICFRGTFNSKLKNTTTFFSIFSNPFVCHYFLTAQSVINPRNGDVTRDDFQRRFLAQHRVQMLEQCCSLSKRCRNNVVTLCYAKNRRCKSFRVT